MYWNVVKREVKTNSFVKLVKSYPCFGLNDYAIRMKAVDCASRRNLLRIFNKKYYYETDFDFE